MKEWGSYFDGLGDHHPIFRAEAGDYVRKVAAALPMDRKTRVLDFGCGFGYAADMLAPKVKELFLWDKSKNMRRYARANTARHKNVRFLDLTDPDALSVKTGFDYILVNSVAQYMRTDDFTDWLVRWRGMLAPGGRLVISDLIPNDYNTMMDMSALIVFSARNGFLTHAIREGFSEFKRYWKTRSARPLSRIERADLRHRADAKGLSVQFLPGNLTYRKKRITAVLRHASHIE